MHILWHERALRTTTPYHECRFLSLFALFCFFQSSMSVNLKFAFGKVSGFCFLAEITVSRKGMGMRQQEQFSRVRPWSAVGRETSMKPTLVFKSMTRNWRRSRGVGRAATRGEGESPALAWRLRCRGLVIHLHRGCPLTKPETASYLVFGGLLANFFTGLQGNSCCCRKKMDFLCNFGEKDAVVALFLIAWVAGKIWKVAGGNVAVYFQCGKSLSNSGWVEAVLSCYSEAN